MSKKTKQLNPCGLSDREMERFHLHAADALQGRAGKYYLREFLHGANIVFVGALPITGMIFFDWSAVDLLIFLLIGMWFGIVCDGFKLVTLNQQVKNEGEKYFDDMYVWATVDVIRRGRSDANQQQRNASYTPGMGCFIDVVFGGVGMVVMFAGAAEKGLYLWGSASRAVLFLAFGLGAFRIGRSLWEVYARKRNFRSDPPKVACGARGVGLFLMMFVVLMVADHAKENNQLARITLLLINASVICYGVLSIASPLLLRSETRWLREYLERKEQEGSARK